MNLMEKIVSLAKRRGFIYPSSEIYGGLGNFYDFGHLGVLLKRNIKNIWWKTYVLSRDDIFGLDSSLILHPQVWQASGHLKSFSDPLTECLSCHKRFRLDDLTGDKPPKDFGKLKCPECGGKLKAPRQFNLMFKTFIGTLEDSASAVYLRPETAQGIFINFRNYLSSYHPNLPFGIAQIGKAFRNEITPGNFIFRTREFEQMEIEYFIEPGKDDKWYKYWINERLSWYKKYSLKEKNLRLRAHGKKELSHYSKATSDIEYLFPWGWGELEGIANRTDFDLSAHQKQSKRDMRYFDEKTKKSFFPFVIEPSAGADRSALAFLIDAYHEDGKRVVLRFHPKIAPVKVAVFPLVKNKKELVDYARSVYSMLQDKLTVVFDDRGNIGKRYYAQDEIGTPFCVTVDYDTLSDDTVTVRDRDTTTQERVKKNKLLKYFQNRLDS